MKRVLITGGAGFIAHHTIKYILENTDWEIVSLDRLDYSGNLNRIADMMNEFDKRNQNRVRIVFHDLRAEVNEMLQADLGNFNYIIHMVASSHVDRSIDDPMCFVLDNVVATCNILNFSRKNNYLGKIDVINYVGNFRFSFNDNYNKNSVIGKAEIEYEKEIELK